MSQTTWKTESPTWKSRLLDFFLCGAKAPPDGNMNPELDRGIGAGKTAHEVVSEYNLRKRQTMDGQYSLAGSTSGRSLNLNITPSKSLRNGGDVSSKASHTLYRTQSEEDDLKWLSKPWSPEDDDDEGEDESVLVDAEALNKAQKKKKKKSEKFMLNKKSKSSRRQSIEQSSEKTSMMEEVDTKNDKEDMKDAMKDEPKVAKNVEDDDDEVPDGNRRASISSQRSNFDVPDSHIAKTTDLLVKDEITKGGRIRSLKTKSPTKAKKKVIRHNDDEDEEEEVKSRKSERDSGVDTDDEFMEFMDQVKNEGLMHNLPKPNLIGENELLTRQLNL